MFRIIPRSLLVALTFGILLGGLEVLSDDGSAEVEYQRDIQPLLEGRCHRCHGADRQRGGLRLDVKSAAMGGGDSGEKAIVPGHSAQGRLIQLVASEDDEERMPPENAKEPRLNADEIALLRRWIDQGAPYEKHWSFIQPEAEVPTGLADSDWVENPIDAFVLKRLEDEGLSHATEADKTTLIRPLIVLTQRHR